MTRENNIYGKLVNNKFSDLLTANMNTTWLQMHVVLDREMPQDKEKRRGLWVSWKSTGTVIAIAMLASAISYYSYQKRTSISTDNNVHGSKTVKEIKLVPAPLNPLNKKSIFSTEPAEQEFPTANASPGTGVLTTQAILSNDDDANRKGLPQRGFHNLNVPEVNNKIEAKKLSNNYTGEGFNSHGMVIEKRYSLSAMPVIEHLSTEKLLSKGDLIIPGHLSFHPLNDKKSSVFQKKTGWVLGAAIHYNAPMSNQEMSTININGKKNTLVDFIPSVFAQYHLNNKWYVETGFQFSSPQYTPDLKLFSSCVDVAVGKRKESAVWLNKLYYMSVPLSVHFKPFNRFSVGAGIQYSFLKRSLLMDEHAGWQEDNNGQWQKTYSTVTVKSQKIKSKGNSNSNNTSPGNGNGNSNGNGSGNGNGNGNGSGNGNGNSNGPGWGTPSGTATPASNGIELMSTQFRSIDLRYLIDLNYTWKRYTLGTRYTAGINDYISTRAQGHMLEVKDKNKAIQVYVRMNVLDLRKKKSFR